MTLSKQINALSKMSLPALKKEFARVTGRPANSGDKAGMIRVLSERLTTAGKAPAAPAATKARRAPAKGATTAEASPFTKDDRLPEPGTTITVTHKGKTYSTKFLGADGFDYEGERFRSLSAIASKILGGASVNGYLWFGLVKRAAPAAKPQAPAAPKAKHPAKAKKAPRAKAAKASAKKS